MQAAEIVISMVDRDHVGKLLLHSSQGHHPEKCILGGGVYYLRWNWTCTYEWRYIAGDMATARPLNPLCPLCKQPVKIEASKTDEHGQAVHEDCYLKEITQRKVDLTPWGIADRLEGMAQALKSLSDPSMRRQIIREMRVLLAEIDQQLQKLE